MLKTARTITGSLSIKALWWTMFALLPLWAQPATATSTLKVGTYNIRLPSNADTGERDWNVRRAAVVETIKTYDYDIIGLNECHGGVVMEYLEQQLTDYAFVKYSDCVKPGSTTENYNPILYKKELFTLLDSGQFFLANDITRPTISWDNSQGNYRFTVWAKLKVKATDEILYYFETHLDHLGDDARNEQTRVNMEQVRRIAGGYPAILSGDHNSSKVRIPFYNMMCCYMQDARNVAARTVGISAGDGTLGKHKVDGQDFWDPNHHTGSRLDYIWVHGATVEEYITINDTFGRTQTPSDHFAIQSTITLEEYRPVHKFLLSQGEDIKAVIDEAVAGDTILVQSGKMTIPGSGKTATVKIDKSLTIIGGYDADFQNIIGRTVVDGAGSKNHLITVNQGCALELYNFELTGGNAPTGGATAQGGAIYCPGNVLYLDNCCIHDNKAYSNGGGVYCAGALNIRGCEFYNNTSSYGSGGAVYTPVNTGELYWRFSIIDSEFYNNTAAMGSACYNGGFSWLHVSRSSFHHNNATNSATFYASRTGYNGQVCFVNNTFTANTVTTTALADLPNNTKGGAALLLNLNGERCNVALVNNTIVGNHITCNATGSIPADFYGAAVNVTTDATVRLYNNIIAGNSSNATTGGDICLTNHVHVDTQRNVYSSKENIHMNTSDNDIFMSSYANAVNALGTMLDGEVTDGQFIAHLGKEGLTSTIAVKSLSYGTKYINDVPFDNFSEARFLGDIDNDAEYKSTLLTDQRRAERNTSGLATRGAYEYGVQSGIENVFNESNDRISYENDDVNDNHQLYNLLGQRVGADAKGIIIKNGKKVLNK